MCKKCDNKCRECQSYSEDQSVGFNECTYDLTEEEYEMYFLGETKCPYFNESEAVKFDKLITEKYLKSEIIAKDVSDFLNHGGNVEEFVHTMTKEHRHLQNEFTFLCIEWLRTCADKNYEFDGRNEYSHTAAEKMINALDGIVD
jgi:hypothetical protein